MRKFDFTPEIISDTYQPQLIEGNPCYEASSYDAVMYDESPDGDLIQCDMTQILLNQEKYRRLLGDMNVNTAYRDWETMSERQAEIGRAHV